MATPSPYFVSRSDSRTPLLHPSASPDQINLEFSPTDGFLITSFHPLLKIFSRVFASVSSSVYKVYQSLKEDPRRAIHSLKMALALALAVLLVLLEFPYEQFGSHAIWAVMTVVVVFELTVGATLSKGLNRGVGTMMAGFFAIGIGQLAEMAGDVFHPVIIGVSVFFTGGIVTYAKLWPAMKSYEVGFRTFLITFCLIMVTGYRIGDPLKTAMDRFVVIAIGAAIGLVINLFVFPIWAGDELHQFISQNFGNLADSLEECVHKYLQGITLERCPTKIVMGLAADDPVYKGYRAALISASKEESLVNFAIWEPPHGHFKMMRYPWVEYVKVGAVLRHCIYSVVALHGCLRAKVQAPVAVRRIFEDEFREISAEAAKVLRDLGEQVRNMCRGKAGNKLGSVHKAVARLQESYYLHSYYLVKADEKISEDEDLSRNVALASTGSNNDGQDRLVHAHSTDLLQTSVLASELDKTKRHRYKKLYSWPIRATEGFCSPTNSAVEQRVRVLESASALSLGTFSTLLVEVVTRLDYVVNAVEELSQLAKFKDVSEVA